MLYKLLPILFVFVSTLFSKTDTTYYPNNTVRSIIDINESGDVNGAMKKYDKQGNLRLITHFRNGKYDGKSFKYHADGKKKQQVFYVNGMTEDWKMHWDENGFLRDSTLYKNDKKIERFEYFYGTTTLRLHHYYIHKDNRDHPVMQDSHDLQGRMISQIRNGNGSAKRITPKRFKCESHEVFKNAKVTVESSLPTKDHSPDCSPLPNKNILPWDVKKYGALLE